MRIFARRERPHPGAQLTLFETADGWRYSLWVTNLPATLRGWRGQLAYIDAAHRVHARVEDAILHRQRHRNRQIPLPVLRDQRRMAICRPDRRHPAGLAQAARPRRRPGPRGTQDPPSGAARRCPADPQRPAPPAENPRDLALGRCHRHRLDQDRCPAASPLTRGLPIPATHGRENPGDRGTPATRPVSRATVIPAP
jgi:hypothetical protein